MLPYSPMQSNFYTVPRSLQCTHTSMQNPLQYHITGCILSLQNYSLIVMLSYRSQWATVKSRQMTNLFYGM